MKIKFTTLKVDAYALVFCDNLVSGISIGQVYKIFAIPK